MPSAPESRLTPGPPVPLRRVLASWLPLAGSWLLMGLELPLVSAIIARLPNPTLNLAAYAGLVFPIALLIESPIIMLLAASTAVVRDRESYRIVRRFMVVAAGALTVLHALVAFTPLFDFVAGSLIGVPRETWEPGRLGLQLMLPWTFSIAYRRTQQGVLIRNGRPRAVTVGTLIRLGTNAAVLAIGVAAGSLPGIAVGAGAVACGVVAEALYAAWAVRPVLHALPERDSAAPPLEMRSFLRFYGPLSITPLINFLAMPLAAAGMSRMPMTIESLAAWPAVNGLTFTLRSAGFAYNEVVVASLDHPRSLPALRRFAGGLGWSLSGVLLALAASPGARLWFDRVAGLPESLAGMAAVALLVMAPMPALSTWQSMHQGVLVHSRQTRGVTESVVVQLIVTAIVLAVGVAWPRVAGIRVVAIAMVASNAAQLAWLAWRAKAPARQLERQDAI